MREKYSYCLEETNVYEVDLYKNAVKVASGPGHIRLP